MKALHLRTGLHWSQPHAMRQEFEMRDDVELLMTMRFRSTFGSFATAEGLGGCWTFKRTGFWKPVATVRECKGESDLASYRNDTWLHGGTLTFADGSTLRANSNFWMTQYGFQTEDGGEVVTFRHVTGLLHASAAVDIAPSAALRKEMSWLVAFGWYLVVMNRQDQAAAVS